MNTKMNDGSEALEQYRGWNIGPNTVGGFTAQHPRKGVISSGRYSEVKAMVRSEAAEVKLKRGRPTRGGQPVHHYSCPVTGECFTVHKVSRYYGGKDHTEWQVLRDANPDEAASTHEQLSDARCWFYRSTLAAMKAQDGCPVDALTAKVQEGMMLLAVSVGDTKSKLEQYRAIEADMLKLRRYAQLGIR